VLILLHRQKNKKLSGLSRCSTLMPGRRPVFYVRPHGRCCFVVSRLEVSRRIGLVVGRNKGPTLPSLSLMDNETGAIPEGVDVGPPAKSQTYPCDYHRLERFWYF
jgi:hypothetical protein